MAKKIPCIMIANNNWGYCYHPERFDSIGDAKREGKWLVENGYACSYRLFPQNKTIKN